VIQGNRGLPSKANRGFINNPAWVVTKDGVVVIDPGSSVHIGRMVVDQIRKTTRLPVSHVFNTHVHGDHWLGNQAIQEAWPKAVFLGPRGMIQAARGGADAQWLKLTSDLTEGATDGTRAVIPTEATADGKEYRIGGKTFRIHATTHAHSQADDMIEVVEDRILFTGDNVISRQVMNMMDGSFKGVLKATDRALAVNALYYVPGHGRFGDRTFVEEQKAWFEIMLAGVRRLYSEGMMTDFEMKPIFSKKLKAYEKWAGWETDLGRQISLAILEVEQE